MHTIYTDSSLLRSRGQTYRLAHVDSCVVAVVQESLLHVAESRIAISVIRIITRCLTPKLQQLEHPNFKKLVSIHLRYRFLLILEIPLIWINDGRTSMTEI